jgi:TonB family protein
MVMKRIPQSLFLAVFVFVISSFAQTQPRPTAPEELWKEFSSTVGRFKVALPGNPTETSKTIESGLGKIERHTFTLGTGSGAFLVSYSDLPEILTEPDEVKKFLDYAHEAEVASYRGKLLSIAEIALDGYPGREFIAKTPDSKFRMKYYLVGQRFYQIAISTPNDRAKNAAETAGSMEIIASRFFDSFKITGKPEMGGKTTPEIIAVDENGKAVWVKKVGAVDETEETRPVNKVDIGSALKKVAPSYPKEAKAARVSGKVEVLVTISEEGRVIEVIAVSGPELLREAAVQAAKEWVFKPTKADGAPVKVRGLLAFNFELQ